MSRGGGGADFEGGETSLEEGVRATFCGELYRGSTGGGAGTGSGAGAPLDEPKKSAIS